jgi:hypothetical protein
MIPNMVSQKEHKKVCDIEKKQKITFFLSRSLLKGSFTSLKLNTTRTKRKKQKEKKKKQSF